MAMQMIVLVLSCLACVSHGLRAQLTSQREQGSTPETHHDSHADDIVSSSRSLAQMMQSQGHGHFRLPGALKVLALLLLDPTDPRPANGEGPGRTNPLYASFGRRKASSEESGDEDSVSKKESPKKLKAFKRGRPSIVMDKRVEKTLASGGMWDSCKVAGSTAVGQAVMDVDAPTDIVWNQITDFASYPKKVGGVASAQVYKRKKQGRVERIYVKMVSPVAPGMKLSYHIDHAYEPAKNSITWTLDSAKKNDFEEIEGHWHVEPHPKNPSKARVFYEIGLVAPSWLPEWLINKLAKKAVKDATSWVRKESERAAAKLRS